MDKDVSPWRGFGLGKSQNVELSYEGLQPWMNNGSLTSVRWKFACLKPVVDIRQTCDSVVGGGTGGYLPTVLDC